MSLTTWINTYYPIPARRVIAKDAVTHSLTKWRGLRPENIKEHELTVSDNGKILKEIPDSPGRFQTADLSVIVLSAHSCALCQLYIDDDCISCPLYIARNNARCDRARDDERLSPWNCWSEQRNPEPMIYWLEKAIDVPPPANDKI